MQPKHNCPARYNKNNWRVVSPHSMLFHVRLKKVMGIVLGKGFDQHMLRCRGNTLSRNKRVSTRRPFYCYFFFYVCFSLLLNLVSCSNSAFKQDFSEIKKSYPADLLTKNQKTVGKVEFVKFSCGTGNSSMHGESKVMIHVDMARMATRSLQLRAS